MRFLIAKSRASPSSSFIIYLFLLFVVFSLRHFCHYPHYCLVAAVVGFFIPIAGLFSVSSNLFAVSCPIIRVIIFSLLVLFHYLSKFIFIYFLFYLKTVVPFCPHSFAVAHFPLAHTMLNILLLILLCVVSLVGPFPSKSTIFSIYQ